MHIRITKAGFVVKLIFSNPFYRQIVAGLLKHGLLKASYVPDKSQRALRDLTRYRTKVVQQRAQVINRVQKVLEDANIKLSSVATDVLGVSGRAMLDALIAGETNGALLARLARGRLKKKEAALEEALTGMMGEHHRFLLSQQLALFDFLSQQIEQLNHQIETQVAAMDDLDSPPGAPRQAAAVEEEEKATPLSYALSLPTNHCG